MQLAVGPPEEANNNTSIRPLQSSDVDQLKRIDEPMGSISWPVLTIRSPCFQEGSGDGCWGTVPTVAPKQLFQREATGVRKGLQKHLCKFVLVS